jgi:3-deoxy-D-manno-octulosonic-acid transferase
LKKTLGSISLFCMQSNIDAQRIVAIGAPSGRVRMTGNMKFDVARPKTAGHSAYPWLKPDDELLVAGSTHEGEEEIIVDVFKELSEWSPKLRLLIAPRHTIRVADIEKAVRRFGLEPVRVSALAGQPPAGNGRRIMILDSIGHLNDFYELSTFVFMGGSLVKYGGHNPIEPALFEKPIILGPYMFNFKDITVLFLNSEAALQVSNRVELKNVCERLMNDPAAREQLGANARKVVADNQGAAEKNMKAITELIASHG